MSADTPLSESARGYLSEASKRRFTLVAGVLGAVFFLAQFLLPMVAFLLIVFPSMMLQEFRSAHLDRAVLWRGDVWYTEEVRKFSLSTPNREGATAHLRHMTLAGLAEAEDSVVIPRSDSSSGTALLPQGDRLWLLGGGEVSYYEKGQLTNLGGGARVRHASRPFLYEGLPTVVTWGRSQAIRQLIVNGGSAEWCTKPFALDLPIPEGGSVERVEGVQVGERLYLVAELRDRDSEEQELYYREMGSADWRTAVSDLEPCKWEAVAYRDGVAIVLSNSNPSGSPQFSVVTPGEGGGETRRVIGDVGGRFAWRDWRGLVSSSGIILLSEGMPGSRRLVEIADGKIVRRVEVKGGFPFGGNMMAMMMVPQLMPFALSLALALILSYQMRRHRVGEYMADGTTRVFASLWQRAMAQAVDAVVLGAGMVVAFIWMARAFSDPERMIEEGGPMFPLVFFGLFALGFLWMIGVLVLFSFFEGRWGKTPGKWLVRIRVLGSDLQPCGFGRALVRNLLTFVDGFFNFLVGILLVALTEHWQRLGDLAARTLVFVDERGTAGT